MSNARERNQSNDQAVSSSSVNHINHTCSPLVALPDELKCMINMHLPFSAKANLAQTCRAYHSFFNQTLVKTIDPDYQAKHTQPNYQLTYQPYIRFHRKRVQKFLNHVIYGEQEEAETMLKRDPGLLLAVGKVEDYSGRKIEGTALQMALGAEDVKYHDDEECMVEIIHKYLKQLPNGENIITEQTAKQFPEGWEFKEEQHVMRDSDVLNAVINTIANSENSADWEKAIHTLRTYLEFENKSKLIQTGKHFNHQLLVLALDLYNQNYDRFGGFNSTKNNAVWQKVIGTIERYVPAATAQALCTGLGTIVDKNGKLQRKLTLHNYHSDRTISYFPLDIHSDFLLGWNFAVYSYYESGGSESCRRLRSWLPFYKTYVDQKYQTCGTYVAPAAADNDLTAFVSKETSCYLAIHLTTIHRKLAA